MQTTMESKKTIFNTSKYQRFSAYLCPKHQDLTRTDFLEVSIFSLKGYFLTNFLTNIFFGSTEISYSKNYNKSKKSIFPYILISHL